jgi:hypothetical protein
MTLELYVVVKCGKHGEEVPLKGPFVDRHDAEDTCIILSRGSHSEFAVVVYRAELERYSTILLEDLI